MIYRAFLPVGSPITAMLMGSHYRPFDCNLKVKNEIAVYQRFTNKIKESIKNELKKDLKREINDEANALKEKIKDELEKDLKREINDEANALKEKIKDELEKDLKCEIDDEANALKEKIKDELEKDLKREINDEANALKEKIKDELEKDLKCEIDDETQEKMKNKIKDEIKDEIDCKSDRDSEDKGEVIDDGSTEVIEGILITEEYADNENCGVNAQKYKSESGGHIGKVAWFTKDLLEQFLPELMNNEKILEHFDSKSQNQYHAENFGITFRCEDNQECGKNINFTFAVPSNMWCNKGSQQGNAGLLCRDEVRSIKTSACCPTALPYGDPIYSANFFVNDKCPNLILDLEEEELKECVGKTIVAKLEVPMIVVDKEGFLIDRNGDKVANYKYFSIKDRLNYKGEIKDSSGKSPDVLLETEKVLEKSLWHSDKEVKLKIPDMSAYFPGDNEDNSVFADTNLI